MDEHSWQNILQSALSCDRSMFHIVKVVCFFLKETKNVHQGTKNNLKINSFFAQSIFQRIKLLEKLNIVHSTKATSSQGSLSTRPWPYISIEENDWKGQRRGMPWSTSKENLIQWNIDLMKNLALSWSNENWFNETVLNKNN